jgi:hypothetical protein
MKVGCPSASHEGVLGIGGVASLILKLGTIRKSVVHHYPCLFTEVPVSETWVVQALCMAFFSVGEWWCLLTPNNRAIHSFRSGGFREKTKKIYKVY